MDKFTCAECHLPIDPPDELILGEVPFHRGCADEWIAKFGDEIEGIQDVADPF